MDVLECERTTVFNQCCGGRCDVGGHNFTGPGDFSVASSGRGEGRGRKKGVGVNNWSAGLPWVGRGKDEEIRSEMFSSRRVRT